MNVEKPTAGSREMNQLLSVHTPLVEDLSLVFQTLCLMAQSHLYPAPGELGSLVSIDTSTHVHIHMHTHTLRHRHTHTHTLKQKINLENKTMTNSIQILSLFILCRMNLSFLKLHCRAEEIAQKLRVLVVASRRVQTDPSAYTTSQPSHNSLKRALLISVHASVCTFTLKCVHTPTQRRSQSIKSE